MLTASVRRPSVRPPSCRNRATAGQELGSHRAVPALLPASSSSNWATPKQEGYKTWQSLGGMGAWQALQQNDANMTDQSQWGTQGEEIQKPSKQNRQPTHDRECHQVVDRDETGSKSAHAQSSERTTTGHQRGTPRPAHGQNTPLSGRGRTLATTASEASRKTPEARLHAASEGQDTIAAQMKTLQGHKQQADKNSNMHKSKALLGPCDFIVSRGSPGGHWWLCCQ